MPVSQQSGALIRACVFVGLGELVVAAAYELGLELCDTIIERHRALVPVGTMCEITTQNRICVQQDQMMR